MDGSNSEVVVPDVARPAAAERSAEAQPQANESLPTAGSPESGGQPAAASVRPKLSAADVAAAIAAMPSPEGTAAAMQTAAQAPQTANDVDRIENEWVQAAEGIIKQTAGSPYGEEEAIEDLQIDYLKKRYGKIIEKKPNV